jgi:hypothetical protein
MPSSSKSNFMQQLFAHSRRKALKRARSQMEPLIESGFTPSGHDPGQSRRSLDHEPQTMLLETFKSPPLRNRQRLQRILAYVKCHHQAMQDEPSYPVVSRVEHTEASFPRAANSVSCSTRHPKTLHSSAPPDVWGGCLPRLLLILALNVQCKLIVDECPSYEVLRAQLLAERRKCQALAQEKAEITDRLSRFKQDFVALRDQYKYVDQLQRERTSPKHQDDGPTTFTTPSTEAIPTAASHHRSETLVVSPRSAFAQQMMPSRLPAVAPKPNPRRVTASPGRILHHLSRGSVKDGTESRVSDTATRSSHAVAASKAASHRTSASTVGTVTSEHRQSVPNPFHMKRPETASIHQHSDTGSARVSIAASPLPAWVIASHEKAKKQSAAPTGDVLTQEEDDSQTIISPFSQKRRPCEAHPTIDQNAPRTFSAPSSDDQSCDPTPPAIGDVSIRQTPQNDRHDVYSASLNTPSSSANRMVHSKDDTPKTGGCQMSQDDSQTVVVPSLLVPSSAPTVYPTSGKKKSSSANKMALLKDDVPKTGSGWISTRHSKAFVAEVDGTKIRGPLGGGAMPQQQVAPFKTQGIAHRLFGSNQNPCTDDSDFMDTPSQKPRELPYQEVVRKKEERDRLQRFECEECGQFIQAICDQDSQGVYDRHALLCSSRHRARFPPPLTPEDFWELSFIDERDTKRRKAQDSSRARDEPAVPGHGGYDKVDEQKYNNS